MGGVYAIPAVFMDVRGAFTNTVPIDAYRGAGKPEANYLIERLIDIAARRNGWDPVDLRRRNVIAAFPYRSALGMTVDCGRFAANLDDALAQARDTGFTARHGAPTPRRAAGCGGWASAAFSKRRAARRTKPPKYASIPTAGFR
jgi:carbon-monoxide dehydrogenase large subunit